MFEAVCNFLQFIPLEDEILEFFRTVASQILQQLRGKPCLPSQPDLQGKGTKRKSSCVNARGIPTAAYQVLPSVILYEVGYPPTPIPIGTPPWARSNRGGYPRWDTPPPARSDRGVPQVGYPPPPSQVQQGGTRGGVHPPPSGHPWARSDGEVVPEVGYPPQQGLTGGTKVGYTPPWSGNPLARSDQGGT